MRGASKSSKLMMLKIKAIRFLDGLSPSYLLFVYNRRQQEMAMTTQSICTSAFAPGPATISLGRVWTVVRMMLQARRTRRLLAEMDGRLLADIGANRADAAMEANRKFWDIR